MREMAPIGEMAPIDEMAPGCAKKSKKYKKKTFAPGAISRMITVTADDVFYLKIHICDKDAQAVSTTVSG